MPINRILFQSLRDGYNTKGLSERLENITKEMTTAEANLESLFQNLRDGYNTKGRSERLENITKEITTAEANLESFTALTQHVGSNHNTELKVPEKEVKKDINNCPDDIIGLKFDHATGERSCLADISKFVVRWKS